VEAAVGDDWKYIVFDWAATPTAVLFPPHLTHADVAYNFRPAKPVGAGFVRFDEARRELVCYGRSESLKLGPREEDSFYVNRLMPR
jgi:hypothetical protein